VACNKFYLPVNSGLFKGASNQRQQLKQFTIQLNIKPHKNTRKFI